MHLAQVRLAGGRATLAAVDRDIATPLAPRDLVLGRDPLRDLIAAGLGPEDCVAAGDPFPVHGCELGAPLLAPSKIIAIGLNYIDHASESGMDVPKAPLLFTKTTNCIVGPADVVRFSLDDTNEVDYEAELAVVVGRRAKDVTERAALEHAFGYMVANDVSARDMQFSDGQWTRGKCLDTFCPTGPWITTADEIDDVQSLGIRCRVNGVTLQDSSTAQMVFGVAELISYVSRFMTLEPGDIILTGTPSGVGFGRKPPVYLKDGDVLETEIEALGQLTNVVMAASAAPDAIGHDRR